MRVWDQPAMMVRYGMVELWDEKVVMDVVINQKYLLMPHLPILVF